MVTQRELASIVKRAKETAARVRVKFKGHRYALIIDSFVRAEDLGGGKVEWSRAFGSLTPAQALSSLPVDTIEVSLPDRSLLFKDLRDLLKWAL